VTRVNLLRAPSVRRRRSEPFRARRSGVLASAVALTMLLGALGSCAWGLHRETARLDDQIARARVKASRLRFLVAREDAVDHASQLLRIHVDALEELGRARRGRVRVLEAIREALPADCWLTAVTDEAGDAVRIEGRAPALSSLFAFVARLDQTGVFRGGVDVLESHAANGEAQGDLAASAFTVRTFLQTRPAPKGGPAGHDAARSSAAR
jgi:Tfp pilus assembly protein PilN